MNKEQYESLVSSSGWSAMKGYLFDVRSRLAEELIEGRIPIGDRDDVIMRCQNLKDLAEMDWPTIAKFYNIPEDKEAK